MVQRHFFDNSILTSSKIKLMTAIGLSLLCLIILSVFFIGHRHRHYTELSLALPQLKTAKSLSKNNPEWQTITAHQRDTLGKIFQKAGLSSQVLQAVLHENPHTRQLTAIKPNQQIKLHIKNKILEQLETSISPTERLLVKRQGEHYKTAIEKRQMDTQILYVSATVKGSLYQTAKRMNIPYKIMQQMTDVFTWEIDFAKEVKAGDQFTIMYEGHYIDDKLVSSGDIIAVSYTNRGTKHQAIRYTLKNGSTEYFNIAGKSLKKAFTRYPLRFSHISSTFTTSRYHPILHYRRAHKGVDLAARLGTPVVTTGDGQVVTIERNYGYGNMIKINHGRGYATVYGHLLKFQKGLSRGAHVKRGQVIGYVGQTGLATGPHLHYEFHVNGVPKNPTTVKIPLAEPMSHRELAQFKITANKRLAQLKLFEDAELASTHHLDDNG